MRESESWCSDLTDMMSQKAKGALFFVDYAAANEMRRIVVAAKESPVCLEDWMPPVKCLMPLSSPYSDEGRFEGYCCDQESHAYQEQATSELVFPIRDHCPAQWQLRSGMNKTYGVPNSLKIELLPWRPWCGLVS